MTMRFNFGAKLVRCPQRRPSTSLSNAFKPLLAEMRGFIAMKLRGMARARHGCRRPMPNTETGNNP